jgi:hypothetical protein
MVETPNGFLRVEAYDLSDPNDSLNPSLAPYLNTVDVRAFGGSWIPCGPAAPKVVPTQSTAPEIPVVTSVPPQPTAAPTNKDYPIATATQGPAPTLEVTATDIP